MVLAWQTSPALLCFFTVDFQQRIGAEKIIGAGTLVWIKKKKIPPFMFSVIECSKPLGMHILARIPLLFSLPPTRRL